MLHQHVDNEQFSEARLRCLATLLLLLSHAHKWDKWPFGGGGGDSLKAIACFKCCLIDATLGSVLLVLLLVSFVSKCVFGSSEQCSLFLFLLLFLSFDSVFCYNNSQWMLCLQNEWSHNVSVCVCGKEEHQKSRARMNAVAQFAGRPVVGNDFNYQCVGVTRTQSKQLLASNFFCRQCSID